MGIGSHWLWIGSNCIFLWKLWWNLDLCKTQEMWLAEQLLASHEKLRCTERIIYVKPVHGRSLSGVRRQQWVMKFFTCKERTWLEGLQWRMWLEKRDVPCGLDSDQSRSEHNLQWINRLLHYILPCALTERSLRLRAHRCQSLITRCLSLLPAEPICMFSSHFNNSLL